MNDADGDPEQAASSSPSTRLTFAVLIGRILVWAAAATTITMSVLITGSVNGQEGLVGFYGIVFSLIALMPVVVRRRGAILGSGLALTAFSLIAGFSIGMAFAPGALLMLVSATLPLRAGEPWRDRFVGLVMVPPILAGAGLAGAPWQLLPFIIVAVAVAIMFPYRRWKAVPWALLTLPLLVAGIPTTLIVRGILGFG